ncbi:MAG: hypothetical protein KGS72_02665 [Cyanobacteria bacterium REEB67]|nr:hypothetical protein [Cyanobacteria bacterium REEB67]
MALRCYWLGLIPYLLLAALATASFANTLGGYFVCDDLLHLGYLWRAFNGEAGLLLAPFYSPWLKDTSFYNFYRPLTELSFALDYMLYGVRAVGYHLTSLTWHVVNVWLLFALIKTLTDSSIFYISGSRERTNIAFFTAAIWSVYPTHSEAIGWIAARSDLLATAFYLTTMILFLRRLDVHKGSPPFWTKLWALPMVLGFFCKELTISLPFTLLALAFFKAQLRRQKLTPTLSETIKSSWPAFAITAAYVCLRALAIGDLIGGYAGSIGETLNTSLASRWLYTQSLFKIFHPFNDQLIDKNNPLRLSLRLIWGACGVMTLVCARVGGAIASKYRLILFAFAWLFFTLAPNLQVWNFSSTMAGGRIAYLPTIAIVLLIVLSVYPIGVSALSGNKPLYLKLAGMATLSALTVVFALTTIIDNRAWLQVSDMVRRIAGQLGAMTDDLPSKKRIALVNLPAHVKGAFAFTAPGMVEALLKPPLATDDSSASITVLDQQPCSYPLVNFSDFRAATQGKVSANSTDPAIELYYYDQNKGLLVASTETAPAQTAGRQMSSPQPSSQSARVDLHDFDAGGENFRFKIAPPLKPIDYEYARFTLTLSPGAVYDKASQSKEKGGRICYLWDNCPPNDDGESDAFKVQMIDVPASGKSKSYLVHLGEDKLWLATPQVSYMQVFLPYLVDSRCRLDLQFLSGEQVAPTLHATVSGESAIDARLSSKLLAGGQILTLAFDAEKLSGACGVKLEILPPYHYFDHYNRQLTAPDFNSRDLKVVETRGLKGCFVLKANDFPKSAVYQCRVGAVDAQGKIIGDFSEAITIDVRTALTAHEVQSGIDRQ